MAFWSVARTLPQRERFASERLEERGFETFAPRIKVKRSPEPLFANYVFVRLLDRWRAIDSTLGVLRLVRFGEQPARCPDHEVEALKAQIDGHGFVRLPDAPLMPARRKISAGTRVKITGGPFAGLSGIHSGLTAQEREIVLLVMLGASRRVRIAAGFVAPS
jgi:transcriptional antiterminator RfaH